MRFFYFRVLPVAILLCIITPMVLRAGYKPRPWTARARDTYRANLTSEGITIGAMPLYTDALAGQAFDKNDIVTRGIMPLEIAIFNDNDFPVTIDALSIELISGTEHLHTLLPGEVVARVFQKGKNVWIPNPMPRVSSGGGLNQEALYDFDQKFLNKKTIAAHSQGGGFLFFHVPDPDIIGYVSASRIYIPNVYRNDTGTRMVFFEFEMGSHD